MTLVLSVHGSDTFWVLVDRRLSYGGLRPPIDDAMKVLNLETTDGVGLLAYAGLGATSRGTQPSEWMKTVLRGRGSLKFEAAFSVLADAATRELPKHPTQMPVGAHTIIAPAFVRGVGSRHYSIENVIDGATGKHYYHFTSWQQMIDSQAHSVRLALGGTGGFYLAQTSNWQRILFSLVKAHDRGRIADYVVADHLATLNYRARVGVKDGTVGPRCIVIWRRRPDTRRKAPVGAHYFFTGISREQGGGSIPTIARGMDIGALVSATFEPFRSRSKVFFDTGVLPEEDEAEMEEMRRRVSQLPFEPDERLR